MFWIRNTNVILILKSERDLTKHKIGPLSLIRGREVEGEDRIILISHSSHSLS